MELKIKEALEEDENFKEGSGVYERVMEQAQAISEEITSSLITEIVKVGDEGSKANDFTLTTAILACAKAMVNLSSYAYDNEETFIEDITKARASVVERVVPALLNARPCGVCEACKNGQPCTDPVMDTELLQTKVVPMIADALIEYDNWNKTMYLYTEGRELLNEDSEVVAPKKDSEDVAFEKDSEVVAPKGGEE